MAIKTPAARERILAAARELVLDRGFASTSVDAVLERAGASKGAFFHHFPSKGELGRAIVDEYVADDMALLDRLIAAAEAAHDDPGERLLHVVRQLEALGDASPEAQPGCLMVSFIYENQLDVAGIGNSVRRSIEYWRTRLTELLRAAAATRPRLQGADLPAVADHFFTTIEGAFLLARATGDRTALARQVAQLKSYLELLLA